MKRQLPKNVRQIGNVSDSIKIYMEDYVDTFLNQLCNKAEQVPMGAFLVGEVVREKEEDYLYVYGALRMKRIEIKGKDIIIDDVTWKKACEQCKKYFGDAAILGWYVATPGQALEVNRNTILMHQKFFPKEKTLFIMKDAETKEEKYFIHKFQDVLEWRGHYVYYEKNIEMQNYMIDSRKKNGVTPSEVIEDRAAKNFRHVIKEKMQENEQKKNSRFLYVASTFLVLIVFGIGVTMMNNYERMTGVQDALNVISQKVEKSKEEDKQEVPPEIEEEIEEDVLDDVVEEDVQEEVEEDVKEEVQEEPIDEEKLEELETLETTVADNVYIVKEGDTLATISREQYGDVSYIEAICKINGLEDGNLIFIGQKLLLP